MESSKTQMNAWRKAVDIAIARRCPTDAAKYARLLGREVLNRTYDDLRVMLRQLDMEQYFDLAVSLQQ